MIFLLAKEREKKTVFFHLDQNVQTGYKQKKYSEVSEVH